MGAEHSDLQLMPNEELVEAELLDDMQPPDKHLSALKAMMRLTGVTRVKEIGTKGPSNAANASEANQHIDELNLYNVFFVRDAHVVADFLKDKFPQLTRSTILETLKYTGIEDNLRTKGLKDEQEKGKAPHEIRDPETDPIAKELIAEKEWGFPYYGAVDSTVKNAQAIAEVALDDPTFLTAEYQSLSGEVKTVEEGLNQHINWIRRRMDLNPEGVVESLWLNPLHHANQTWADSPVAFHHADGQWATHHPEKNWGVASVELQAEIYDTLVSTAELYSRLAACCEGQRKHYLETEIEDLIKRAAKLREVVLDKFWVEDHKNFGGYFARGTDRDKDGNLRPLAVRSSDMGHLLDSRLLDGNETDVVRKREAVINNLFSDEMLCPSGIRTLSSDSKLYGEERYHNGNSWPWVTIKIARGLERHGYYGLAYELKKRAWSIYDETKIMPEYATGSDDPNYRLIKHKVVVFDRTLAEKPIKGFSMHQVFQPPQEIQAWTAAALLSIKYEHGERLFHPEIATPIGATYNEQRELEVEVLQRISRNF